MEKVVEHEEEMEAADLLSELGRSIPRRYIGQVHYHVPRMRGGVCPPSSRHLATPPTPPPVAVLWGHPRPTQPRRDKTPALPLSTQNSAIPYFRSRVRPRFRSIRRASGPR